MKLLLKIGIFCCIASSTFADCVYFAKSKLSFRVIDSHTLILSGGPGPDILIKTFAFINKTSSVLVLKDSFCSYESGVLLIDGEVADVNQVTKL